MRDRTGLQEILEAILELPHVYFQPPSSVEMKYPAIVYARDNADTNYAGNNPYSRTQRYQVTVIDKNVDSPYILPVGQLPMSRWERFFVADNLNHDVFSIYY